MGVVAGNITQRIAGSTVEAVDYPATFDDYINSASEGVDRMTEQLLSYLDRCEDAKVVLMGFSQGAQVASDLICGYEGGLFDETEDLADSYKKNILAVVMYGNPAHVADAPWNAGTSTNDGLFARKDVSGCNPYVSVMRSWCDTGDRYCDLGDDSAVHGGYFAKYTQDATDWVVGLYEASIQMSSNTTSTESTSSSAATSTSSTSTDDNIESNSDNDEGSESDSSSNEVEAKSLAIHQQMQSTFGWIAVATIFGVSLLL